MILCALNGVELGGITNEIVWQALFQYIGSNTLFSFQRHIILIKKSETEMGC